jgi:hypothetical protein
VTDKEGSSVPGITMIFTASNEGGATKVVPGDYTDCTYAVTLAIPAFGSNPNSSNNNTDNGEVDVEASGSNCANLTTGWQGVTKNFANAAG